jgi:hypothetical protein
MQEPSSSLTRTFLVPTLLGFVIAAGIAFPSCKKDEAPPPLPSASAAAVETPAPVLTLAQEDAGELDAAPDVKKVGVGAPATSLKKCCQALSQNAKSAPPPTNMYMEAAAAACNGAVAAGSDRGSIVGQVRAALKGAQMPADCY